MMTDLDRIKLLEKQLAASFNELATEKARADRYAEALVRVPPLYQSHHYSAVGLCPVCGNTVRSGRCMSQPGVCVKAEAEDELLKKRS